MKIEIENKKLFDWIKLKDDLVDEGRAITVLMEKQEKIVKQCENEEKRITGAVPADEKLKEEGDKLVVLFNETMKKLDEIGSKIEAKKLEAIPKTLLAKHKVALKENESLERERNKIALKIQKVKDRIIPLVQKEVKPLLNDYDDIETAKTGKNGVVIVETFNYLDQFYKTHKK